MAEMLVYADAEPELSGAEDIPVVSAEGQRISCDDRNEVRVRDILAAINDMSDLLDTFIESTNNRLTAIEVNVASNTTRITNLEQTVTDNYNDIINRISELNTKVDNNYNSLFTKINEVDIRLGNKISNIENDLSNLTNIVNNINSYDKIKTRMVGNTLYMTDNGTNP